MNMLTKLIAGSLAVATLAACDVDKTREGELPDVSVEGGQVPEYEVRKTQEGEMPDVDVEGGQVPGYDVDTPDVDVGTETREVTVPDVNVDMPDDDEEDNVREVR